MGAQTHFQLCKNKTIWKITLQQLLEQDMDCNSSFHIMNNITQNSWFLLPFFYPHKNKMQNIKILECGDYYGESPQENAFK